MGQLNGKTVLLTGGLGTLGQAQARKLVSEGARVVALDVPDRENGEARAKAIGEGVSFLGCDLNDLAGAQKTVEAAAKDIGGFDILINNAALIINRPFEEFSLEEYEDQIRVNSSAAFAMVKACTPAMKGSSPVGGRMTP